MLNPRGQWMGAGQESCRHPGKKEWWQRWKDGTETHRGDGATGLADGSDSGDKGRMRNQVMPGFVGMSFGADGETVNQGQG